MNAKREPGPCGAVDQEAFDKVIRDNISQAGVAAIIAFLQPAMLGKPKTPEQQSALLEVEWFADTLLEMLGSREYAKHLDELSL